MGFSSFFKRQDNYGHKVAFNFNRQGETVNTVLGGVLSIVINLLIYGYLILKLKTMIETSNNSLGARETDTTAEELGTRNFNEMDMLIYF